MNELDYYLIYFIISTICVFWVGVQIISNIMIKNDSTTIIGTSLLLLIVITITTITYGIMHSIRYYELLNLVGGLNG